MSGLNLPDTWLPVGAFRSLSFQTTAPTTVTHICLSFQLCVQITWLNDTNYVNLQAEMTSTKDSWILSFPRDPSALTRSLCTSSSGSCEIKPETACTPDSAALKGAEVETMSIVEATSACSAGSAAASKDGMSLTYGLKVRLKPLHLWGLIDLPVLCGSKLPLCDCSLL